MRALCAAIFLFTATGMAATIGSGNVVVFFGGGSFQLAGDGFDVTGGLQFGNWQFLPCACPPGTVLGTGGSISGGDISGGPGTIGGVHYPYLTYGGADVPGVTAFHFSGPSITLVPDQTTYTVPFSFSGTLAAYIFPLTPPLRPLCPLCPPGQESLPVSGQGIATLQLFTSLGGEIFSTRSMTYEFTPEPGTAISLIGGLAVCLLLRRKRSAPNARPGPGGADLSPATR